MKTKNQCFLRCNKRRGWGKNLETHRRWPNAYFSKIWLFTMHEAWLAAGRGEILHFYERS
jgi:hypothetical protein